MNKLILINVEKILKLDCFVFDLQHMCICQLMGRVALGGGGCSGAALHHWNEVVTSPRRQIAEWHKLHE